MLPPLADRPVAVPDEDPRQPLVYQLLIGHGSAVAVHRHGLDLSRLGEDEDRGDVFSLCPEILMLLRAVDPPEANLLGLPVVEDGDRVTTGHTDDLAGPCAAGRWQVEEKCRDNPRCQSSSQRNRSPHLITSPGNCEARSMPLSRWSGFCEWDYFLDLSLKLGPNLFSWMDNYFHLLAMTPKGNLAEFMRHINISYTSAFNRRHRWVGHLYQGRYKAFLFDADNYLLELSRYIHLNPVRLKAFEKKMASEKWAELSRFRWSSLSGYLFSTKREAFVGLRDGSLPGGRRYSEGEAGVSEIHLLRA